MVLIYYSFTHQLVSFQAHWTARAFSEPPPLHPGLASGQERGPKQEPVSPQEAAPAGSHPPEPESSAEDHT